MIALTANIVGAALADTFRLALVGGSLLVSETGRARGSVPSPPSLAMRRLKLAFSSGLFALTSFALARFKLPLRDLGEPTALTLPFATMFAILTGDPTGVITGVPDGVGT